MKYVFWTFLTIVIFIGVNILVSLAGFHRSQGHYISVVLMGILFIGYLKVKDK